MVKWRKSGNARVGICILTAIAVDDLVVSVMSVGRVLFVAVSPHI
jgi:hypothetical protein